jgi:hypothetical protein
MNWLLILPTDFPTLRPLNIIRTLGKLKGSHLVNKIVNIATPHSQHFCAECLYMEQCLAHNNDSININPYCQCHCNRLRGILCIDSHCFMFKEFQTNIEHVFNYTGWFLSKKKKKNLSFIRCWKIFISTTNVLFLKQQTCLLYGLICVCILNGQICSWISNFSFYLRENPWCHNVDIHLKCALENWMILKNPFY